ncbi:MAG: sulfatase-like hydrolase/transferase [Pirellulaceae bacterium]|nr:sulfatase-like hydrolase/transferase [Pirellulaceae bacterium]
MTGCKPIPQMKTLISCFAFILITWAATDANCAEPMRLAATVPNIILFLFDDLGWKDLGCQSSTYYQTPHINALARQGARFTNGYSACAVLLLQTGERFSFAMRRSPSSVTGRDA